MTLPTQYPPIAKRIIQKQTSIYTFTHTLVQYNNFIILSHQEWSIDDIGGGIGHWILTVESICEKKHGHTRNSCDTQRCLSYQKTCYGPTKDTRHESFMEEVSILTISMFLICCVCVCVCILLFNFFIFNYMTFVVDTLGYQTIISKWCINASFQHWYTSSSSRLIFCTSYWGMVEWKLPCILA